VPGRSDWQWDETLFAGSAEHYAVGRMPYPAALTVAVRDELGLDGDGRLLDVGCGPGSLTHLLAPLFAEAVGVDADAEMVRVAQRTAPANSRFVQLCAEELPAGLGRFRVVALAQAFHWFETEEVARTLHRMLEGGGALVHVGATTHEGEGNVPREQIAQLIERWLGPEKRAGAGFRRYTETDHRQIFDRVGFRSRREVEVARDETIKRSEDEIVASVFSQSFSAPHLFGQRAGEFERELRALLHGGGPFHERPRSITLTFWDA
jgi:ubiquinone/menaquinone biosynthesis C-methylase UbiE